MVLENSSLITKKQHANFRLCNVSGYKTDLLEVHAQDPKLHVVFIPGNPVMPEFSIFQLSSTYLMAKSANNSWKSIFQFHTMQNVLFMAMTEFDKLSDTLDWSFMRQKKNQMAFLFGNDDHWGPTHLLDEIAEKVPGASLTVEQAGHSHAFSCTKDGSTGTRNIKNGESWNFSSPNLKQKAEMHTY
nr:lipid droplet-associated hydrolase [Ipomoea trifida]